MTEATIAGPTAPKLELHRPVKSWVQVTATCNLQCKQCYGDCTPEPKSDEMTVDQFHRVLDDMADSGVIELLVEGGEPLQRPDVLAVLAHAAPKMLVRLRTNGTLLDEAMAERIRAAGIRNLCIDFMGATPETHDWHVGEPGAFEKTLNGLKVSLAAGFETLALMIMTKRNAGEIQRFIDLCAAAGVKRVGILRLYPLGRAKRHWKAMALSFPSRWPHSRTSPYLTTSISCVLGTLATRTAAGRHQAWMPGDSPSVAPTSATSRTSGMCSKRRSWRHGSTRCSSSCALAT